MYIGLLPLHYMRRPPRPPWASLDDLNPPRATSTSHDDDFDVDDFDFDFDFDDDEHVGGRRRWVTSAERRGTTTSSGDDINGAGTETIDIDGARGQERLRPAASSRATGGGDERGRARVWCVTRCDARM